jgi:1,3-beta-galactosyl-N-acetylhexosamine phosphorylase
MLAKLMWDPYADDRKIMKDFLSGYYGDAGKYLLKYIDLMHDEMEAHNDKLDIFHGPKNAARTYLTPELFKTYSGFFDKAEQAVSDRPELLARVRHARMPVYYAGIVNRYGSKKEIFAMIAAFESLAKTCGLEKVEEWKITADMFVRDSLDLHRGRVTIPTDNGIIPETIEAMHKLGADALRDCDGTDFPGELQNINGKIYATYYTTRKDNEWARANPDEVQQCYIMTGFHTATSSSLSIPLMSGISGQLLQPNTRDDIKRWWEVIDRTTGRTLPAAQWDFDSRTLEVTVQRAVPFHEYTVSFLAYLIWDPVHMYNAIINEWKDFEHQITFDIRQPKTRKFSMNRLRKYLQEHPHIDVIRFTTFFHQFTLVFDELRREKYVDWYGYTASVSPYILEQFEKEAGYPFRAEYIIDQGYYNNQYRIPSKQYLDFMAFQRREVCKLAKEMVDITHEYGKEAMMFLGDHWIGTEPFMDDFKTIGLDALVGSVGNGSTYRLISDVQGVKYREGRYLPYFFPDTFHKGGNPVKEAKENWGTSRRALLRKPIDRIGYGGYLKLALDFPEFMDYIAQICDEFRLIYQNTKGETPYCAKTVAVLNAWGKVRSWGCHMVHHALYQKQNYSYAGIIEALSGAAFDVRFISFDGIKRNPALLDEIDVILNIGDADTAHSGGVYWADKKIAAVIRKFIFTGGGFIGVGEPSAYHHQGHFFQLASVLGVEKETGITLNYDKYNWEEQPHFITEECTKEIDFGEGKKNIYALPGTEVLVQKDREVQMAANSFGSGRAVYISGLPYSPENSRILHRAILWSCHGEDALGEWYSDNCNVEVHAYIENRKYCAVNNIDKPQKATVYTTKGASFKVNLAANEILWYQM